MARKQSRLTDVIFVKEEPKKESELFKDDNNEKVEKDQKVFPIETKEDNKAFENKDLKIKSEENLKVEEKKKVLKPGDRKERKPLLDSKTLTPSEKRKNTRLLRIKKAIEGKNFSLVSAEPVIENFQCICGGRGKYGYNLSDESTGEVIRVGKTCLAYCGVELPKKKSKKT